jgi:hypothetical protein
MCLEKFWEFWKAFDTSTVIRVELAPMTQVWLGVWIWHWLGGTCL